MKLNTKIGNLMLW